jgi:multiple sugar transport system permease protein
MIASGHTWPGFRTRRWERASMLTPAVIALAAVTLFPGLYLLYMSVLGWQVQNLDDIRFVGIDNFRVLLQSASFLEAAWTTIVFVTASTALSLVLGLALALALNEELRGRGVMRALLTLPLIVPPVVAGFGWKFLLSSDVGVIGAYLLRRLGLDWSPLGDPSLAMVSVVIADIWSKTSFMFLIMLAGLQAIPTILYEAARIDGASFWKQFRTITLPLLRGVLIVAVILRVLDAINTFDVIFVMTQGGPGTATQTLTILGWKIGFTYFDLGQAAALAVMMMVTAVIAASALIRRTYVEV